MVDAIENREGARAEAVMREHARLASPQPAAGAAQSNPSRSAAGAGAGHGRLNGASYAIHRNLDVRHAARDARPHARHP